MRKFYTRNDIQNILDDNPLKASVSYLDREGTGNPDNYILYLRLSPNRKLTADDRVHIRKALIQVVHLHKKKLDSIENFMMETFNVEPTSFNVKQLDTDYLGTYYRFEILTDGSW